MVIGIMLERANMLQSQMNSKVQLSFEKWKKYKVCTKKQYLPENIQKGINIIELKLHKIR